MNERKLIEADKTYQKVKGTVLNMMNSDGKTEWFTNEAWRECFPHLGDNMYHRIMSDLLKDKELTCEFNRDVSPVKKRWVLKY